MNRYEHLNKALGDVSRLARKIREAGARQPGDGRETPPGMRNERTKEEKKLTAKLGWCVCVCGPGATRHGDNAFARG